MKKLEEQLNAAVEAAEFARSHRNKRISHKDLDYVISRNELPSATLERIRKALEAVHAVLQTVNVKYRQKNLSERVTVVEGVDSFLGRVESLVDAVLGVEELLANVSGQAPFWDEDVARDWIRRLGRRAIRRERTTDHQSESDSQMAADGIVLGRSTSATISVTQDACAVIGGFQWPRRWRTASHCPPSAGSRQPSASTTCAGQEPRISGPVGNLLTAVGATLRPILAFRN